ncbi:hypothetical protein ACLB1T_24615 [Escherichia coli]
MLQESCICKDGLVIDDDVLTMNTMDFIKHDETPLFLLIAHLTAASKIEAPEVLTDVVALLCVVINQP